MSTGILTWYCLLVFKYVKLMLWFGAYEIHNLFYTELNFRRRVYVDALCSGKMVDTDDANLRYLSDAGESLNYRIL